MDLYKAIHVRVIVSVIVRVISMFCGEEVNDPVEIVIPRYTALNVS